jgi:signal transduction histidine kinase
MPENDLDKRKIEELERRCADLEVQLKKIRAEQTNYLQNVSHQLVAPLNAIKWHIENLTAGRMTNIERAKKVMRSVYSQSTIAVHLAKNFALMSNLEEDHALTALKEPLQPVSLCRLVINLADDFQPLGWDREIQIGVEKQDFETAPDVLVMKPLISQVFSNIIENAVKYSENGSHIQIDGRYDRSNDAVIVNVTSRGIPLPPDISEVFTRGFRSDKAKNKYPAGTGFGLYIAKRIVEMHQGSISAAMTQRGAAVFTVSLSVRRLEGKARQREPKNSTSR